jgi:hypothetical protein
MPISPADVKSTIKQKQKQQQDRIEGCANRLQEVIDADLEWGKFEINTAGSILTLRVSASALSNEAYSTFIEHEADIQAILDHDYEGRGWDRIKITLDRGAAQFNVWLWT